MTEHANFSEDLALYALGVLPQNDPARRPLESHLESCSQCRVELAELRSAVALLALSLDMAPPPADVRRRLLVSIAESRDEKRTATTADQKPKYLMSRPWWTFAPVFGTIVLAIFAVMLWRDNGDMRWQLETVRAELQRAQAMGARDKNDEALSEAKKVLGLLTSTEAQRIEVVATGTKPQPHGKAIYNPRQGTLIFVAGNMAPLPSRNVYELWLLPQAGSAPIAVGVFRPDAQGNATLMLPPMAVGIAAKNFAVTVEPEGGSPAPTTPVMMAGA